MPAGDPMVFQQQRDRWIANLVSGNVHTYSVGDAKESIHNIARALITAVPTCVDQSDIKSLTAYRVGVMKLAEVLTGQSAADADGETIRKLMED